MKIMTRPSHSDVTISPDNRKPGFENTFNYLQLSITAGYNYDEFKQQHNLKVSIKESLLRDEYVENYLDNANIKL
jgi:hypothetical protein